MPAPSPFNLALWRRLSEVPHVVRALEVINNLGLPEGHVAAGAIYQPVWNAQAGRDAAYGLKDIDIVYFDPDLTEEAEQGWAERLSAELGRVCAEANDPLSVPLDVKNQARVHLWYERRFGVAIQPYTSVAEAVASWPTPVGALAVRLADGELQVTAPYGLEDLFACVVRPNKVLVSQADYEAKVARWTKCWPHLIAYGWNDQVAQVSGTGQPTRDPRPDT